MYLHFYGFSEEPFKPIANPHFLFLTDPLRKNLMSVTSGIKEGEKIIAITGEVGVGKTTFIYALLRDLDPNISAAFITHPNVTFEDLMAAILGSLTGSVKKRNLSVLLRVFNSFLEDKASRGEKVVIIVDEAQTLAPAVLADLLGLLDLETGASNPLQIIFVGQPELDSLLDPSDLAELNRTINVRCRIESLTQKESKQYIEQHLNRVGRSSAEVLTREAIFLICRYSEGIPRVMNIVCDNAFWFGWQRSKKKIDGAVIGEAVGMTYQRRSKLFHVRTSAEAFLFANILFYVEKVSQRLSVYRQYPFRIYRLGKDFQMAKFLPYLQEGKRRVQGPLKKLSLVRISAKDLLLAKSFLRFKESLRRISIKPHLFPRAYILAKISSFQKIPSSVDRAWNKIYGQRQTLFYLWFSAKECLTKKIPSYLYGNVIKTPIKIPQIKWRWISGKEFLSKRFSFFIPVAIVLFAIGIFLAQKNLRTLFKESEMISKMDQILAAGKVVPSLTEKEIAAVPDKMPESVSEKEEPSENQLARSQKIEESASEGETDIPIHHPPAPTPVSKRKEPTPSRLPVAKNFKTNTPSGDIGVASSHSPSATSRKEGPVPPPAPRIVANKNEPKKLEMKKAIRVEKPVLIHSFASKEIRPGGVWKVYLNASHGMRDMRFIFSTIEMGGSHLNIIELNEKNRRFFSGYITLDTYGADPSLGIVDLTLNVSLQDSAGHFSEPVAFPLSLRRNAIRKEPPQGIFEEKELGTVPIDFKSILNQRYGE